MMNDDFRDMMPTSQEFYADAKAEFGEMVEPDQPTAEVLRESEELDRQLENAYKCDDDDNDGKSNINYDKLTPYDRKRLEGKGCPPSP